MGIRRRGRIIAFQALYGWEYTHAPVEEIIRFGWLRAADLEASAGADPEADAPDFTFPRLLVAGTLENIDQVDQLIHDQLEHWDFSRVSKVDLAILRVSVYALVFQPDIPASVTIDEAIDIARTFGADDSYKFVNGVLDGIRKSRCGDSPRSSA
ncbi:MAG TPA: transcription antitermination factor NusB [Spirochaetia bacterium]|nr:transcription antitermination factor NusB [Spirochaetia bacterium]